MSSSAVYGHQINRVIAKCQTHLADSAMLLLFKDEEFVKEHPPLPHPLQSTSVGEAE